MPNLAKAIDLLNPEVTTATTVIEPQCWGPDWCEGGDRCTCRAGIVYTPPAAAPAPASVRDRTSKVCPRCRASKPLETFGADRSSPDGRYTYCLACERLRRVERYQKHATKEIARSAQWAKDNPAGAKMRHQRKRLRKLGHDLGDLTTAQWERACTRYGGRCAYCGHKPLEGKALTVDHVLALSNGGTHTAANIVPACMSCNAGKRNRRVRPRRPDELPILRDDPSTWPHDAPF